MLQDLGYPEDGVRTQIRFLINLVYVGTVAVQFMCKPGDIPALLLHHHFNHISHMCFLHTSVYKNRELLFEVRGSGLPITAKQESSRFFASISAFFLQ